MNNVLLQRAIKLNNERKRRNRRRTVLQVLSMLVVFCTTYSLILPALTMERDTVCGYEAHTHTEACYAQTLVVSLQCPPIEADAIVHTHGPLCYGEDEALLCTLEEREAHTHEEACYDTRRLTCSENHDHGDSCYTVGEAVLVCELEELVLHSHEEACYTVSEDPEVEPELICTVPVVTEHAHEEGCLHEETVTELCCPLEEHAHSDRCYPMELPPAATPAEIAEEELPAEDAPAAVGEGVVSEESEPIATETEAPTAEPTPAPLAEAPLVDAVFEETPSVFLMEESPAVMAAEAATLTLGIYAWNEYNPVSFAGGNTVSCLVGDKVTLTFRDSGGTYRDFMLRYSGCSLVSAVHTCDLGTSCHADDEWCSENPVYTLVFEITQPTASIQGNIGWMYDGNNTWAVGTAVQPTPTPTPTPKPGNPTYPNRPQSVITGNVNIQRLRFYNLREDGTGVAPLPGCVFEIKNDSGYLAYVASENSPEVQLPAGIPDGTYTITEISAPAGYMRDTRPTRSFTVAGGALVSDKVIGTFLNHSLEELDSSKTAEVENYENRIYKVLLDAESHMRMFEMDPVDVVFVVDQSNSMLFPSGLEETGKQVTLSFSGQNNHNNMEALNLDKSQVYYIISDPHGTSTVWAVWHDGNGWIYQDASYYAKARQNNATGYQDPNEKAIFPENRSYADQKTADGTGNRSNGGGLAYSLSGSGLGSYIGEGNSATFKVYTAMDEYNRLHYLEEALSNMIYELADMNSENRVALVGFTKEVKDEDCFGLWNLNPANAEALVSEVRSINTSGGTRQDLGLQAAYDKYISTSDSENIYTILITDGAPVRSSGSDIGTVGSASDPAGTNTIYAHTKYQANRVKGNSTLMTVGLGMDAVDGGKALLQQIATDANSFCALDDASQLIKEMQDMLFKGFKPKDTIDLKGDVVDEISDSFYPLVWVDAGAAASIGRTAVAQTDKDWIAAQPGDWITLEGKYTTAGAADAAGQILRRDDGTFYVEWKNVQLSDPFNEDLDRVAWVTAGTGASTGRTVVASDGTRDWILLNSGDYINSDGSYVRNPNQYWTAPYGRVAVSGGDYTIDWGRQANPSLRITYDPDYRWKGTVYVKAKEDFIGGNAIETNKTAYIEVNKAKDYFVEPTVNVRLLDMNELSSEVTVYLGDLINGEDSVPLDSLQDFFDNTAFTKLVDDGGNVLNKITADLSDTDGLEAARFYLRYALGRDLILDEWNRLQRGETLHIPYTYDDPSSGGPVGYFSFRLTKSGMSGANPDYGRHVAEAACQPNGTPATEDCDHPAETYTLHVTYTVYRLGQLGRPEANAHNGEAGPGTEVGTGSTLETGRGVIEKHNVHEVHVISGKIEIIKRFRDGLTSPTDRTFTFRLHRQEDVDATYDMTGTVTIPAGASAGAATLTFEPLRRGTYVITEAEDEDYMVGTITVRDTTNCQSDPASGGTAKTVTFTMGNNIAGDNVIGRGDPGDSYTSYIDPVNGVYGAAEFTNTERIYTGEVPVEKIWDDGAAHHAGEAVYVALYDEGELVTEGEAAKLLRLDAANNWQGNFTVALKDKQDSVDKHDYSVKEVSQAETAWHMGWQKALLENDGTTVMYYEKALEDGGALHTEENVYMVRYTKNADGTLRVENYKTVELPLTGGIGTHLYQFSGLLLIAAALVYGYKLRRKEERRRDT